MSARLARLLTLAAIAPFLSGAHCNEDCAAPRSRVVAQPMEKTIYGPAVLVTRPRVTPLAEGLAPFEKRALRVDVSRPVAVVLTRASATAGLADLADRDVAKLQPGDGGEAFRVLAMVEQVAEIPLFTDAATLAEARRAGWDAVVLLPRERTRAPWEASVSVRLGRLVATTRDPESGRCVEGDGAAAAPLSFALHSLPARCGDGVRQEDEDCDDGNRIGGDGCSPYCVREK